MIHRLKGRLLHTSKFASSILVASVRVYLGMGRPQGPRGKGADDKFSLRNLEAELPVCDHLGLDKRVHDSAMAVARHGRKLKIPKGGQSWNPKNK